MTHVVMSYSRGFAWLRAVGPDGFTPALSAVERVQCRPGVTCVVGDRVEVAGGNVAGVLPRRGTLSRAVGPQQQLLAAHVDRLVLVVAVGRSLREGFVMRGLVSATLQGLAPLVVVNKMDVDDGDAAAQVTAWQALGIPVQPTSVVRGDGMDALRTALAAGTSALLGHSGVGKSTLINALRPGANRRTGGLDWQGKGRHVTTMAEAIPDGNSLLVDLPGVRELGLWGATPEDILDAFPDVKAAITRCHFPDCSHDEGTAGCAVLEELDAGRLDPGRVELCLRMQQSVALGLEGGGRL
ncbi:MAG: ribosome small subunit-dependent GTPase A [Deltaproteobacteria bacterium]|nr:ribosome small subunit-dependent GTPase A [Deltaproteobacteria bacterium]